MSSVEWPSQVARRPLPGGVAQRGSGFSDGSGAGGTRRSPPHRNSRKVGIGTLGSRNPGRIGCTLRKRSSAQQR